MSDYKASKEAFVSGTTGSSITHINIISAVALVYPPAFPGTQLSAQSDQSVPLVFYRVVLGPEVPLTPLKIPGVPCRMAIASSPAPSLNDALCRLSRDTLVDFTLPDCAVNASTSS